MFPLISAGQIIVRNASLIRPDSNILYQSIGNRLVVTGKCENAAVVITGGTITRLSDSVYSVQVTEQGDKWFIITEYGQTVFRKKFKAMPLSSFPVAQVGFHVDSVLSVDEILQKPFLNIAVPNSVYFHDGDILRFDLEIIKHSGDIILKRHTTEGNALTKLQKELIGLLGTGDKLVFNRILLSEPSSRLVALRLNIYIR